jgi:hypothetical protein
MLFETTSCKNIFFSLLWHRDAKCIPGKRRERLPDQERTQNGNMKLHISSLHPISSQTGGMGCNLFKMTMCSGPWMSFPAALFRFFSTEGNKNYKR